MTAVQNLTLETLANENIQLRQEVVKRDEKIVYLEEQLNWLKKQLFGAKSERDISSANPNQLELEGFRSIEKEVQGTKTIPAHTRKKPNRDGTSAIQLPKDLPVETTVIDIPEEQKVCSVTGIALVKIGEEVSYRLKYKPGSFYLKEIIRPKYVHPGKE